MNNFQALSTQTPHIDSIYELLRLTSDDSPTIALDLLCKVSNRTKTFASMPEDKEIISDKIVNNVSNFVSSNLESQSNTTRDAKYAIAKATIGTDPESLNDVKVRLGLSCTMLTQVTTND